MTETTERNEVMVEANKKDEEFLKKQVHGKKDHIFKLKNQLLGASQWNKKMKNLRKDNQTIDSSKNPIAATKSMAEKDLGSVLPSATSSQISLDYYDNVSSMAAFQETYDMLKEYIISCEKQDEAVSGLHADIIELLSRFTIKIVSRTHFEDFLNYDTYELSREIEHCWGKFRKIFIKAYKIN